VITRATQLRRRLLAAVLFLLGTTAAIAVDRVVLIANVDNPVSVLNTLEVQKLFLGLTLPAGRSTQHPLRNESDEILRQIFYQNIISMSESTYERRLLALTLQQGRTAPPIYKSSRELLSAVAADPAAISFAWAADVANDPRIKVLRVLGQE
jgi:ABC-type phosphate transport system substrate-binding protein